MSKGALQYYGGKHPRSQKAKWITSLLGPPQPGELYVEPFAGMLGILLSRPPAHLEIVNDLNSNVVNWWKALREHFDELVHQSQYTPHSREFYEQCIDLLASDEQDVVKRAIAFQTILYQSISQSPCALKTSWNIKYNVSGSTKSSSMPPFLKHAELLANRIRNVQLENRDACDIIERTKDLPYALVYCDPPYPGANISNYGDYKVDYKRMNALLREHKGRVAISGYYDYWDDLGWKRYTIDTSTTVGGSGWNGNNKRTEVLWMNHTPRTEPMLFSA